MSLTSEDRQQIQELSSKYAMCMDDGDIETWLGTWAEDGVWEGGVGKFSGHGELRNLLPTLGDRIRNKRHVMTNFVIDGDGNSVSQKCYLMIVDIAKQTPPGTAVYEDRLKKVNGVWKFVHRRVKIDML